MRDSRREHPGRAVRALINVEGGLPVEYVYVLRSGDEDLFKIGRTRDINSRRLTLSTGNPHPLTLFAVIETEHASWCETYLHSVLRSRRVAGEFFAVSP